MILGYHNITDAQQPEVQVSKRQVVERRFIYGALRSNNRGKTAVKRHSKIIYSQDGSLDSERIGLIWERMFFVYGISKQVRNLHSGGIIGLSQNREDIENIRSNLCIWAKENERG